MDASFLCTHQSHHCHNIQFSWARELGMKSLHRRRSASMFCWLWIGGPPWTMVGICLNPLSQRCSCKAQFMHEVTGSGEMDMRAVHISLTIGTGFALEHANLAYQGSHLREKFSQIQIGPNHLISYPWIQYWERCFHGSMNSRSCCRRPTCRSLQFGFAGCRNPS